MVLPELRALANSVGVKGTSGMRKGDLISAIRETRGGGGSQRGSADESSTPTTTANA
jgi:transcription termination factor Rho